MTTESDQESQPEPIIDALGGVLGFAGPSSALLFSLLAMMFAYPFVDDTLGGRLLLTGLVSAVLIAAAFTTERSRRVLLGSLVLALSVLALLGWFFLTNEMAIYSLGLLMFVAFCGLTITHVVAYVMRPGAVTGDKLHAALSAYILMALLWAALYAFIDSVVPGSFGVNGIADTAHPLSPKDFVFFSFTTLTTTGYGNIAPLTHHAQSITILEQLSGTFFVAILIARLASLYQPGAKRPRPPRAHD